MGTFRVRVVRACLLQGRACAAGEEVALPQRDAVDAVLSGRCEEIDRLPKAAMFGPGAIGPG